MKVAILTTVRERPLVTSFHFKWMNRFRRQCKEQGIQLIPLYVLDKDDPCLDLFKRGLARHQHKHITVPRSRLTDKSQAGLAHLRDHCAFSWLLHLDSDEILSLPLAKRWKELARQSLWFGSKGCYFIDISSGKAWEFTGYPDHPVKNGGTCIHRQILEHVDWTLWPAQRDQGLNVMERRRIEKFGYQLKAVNAQDCYGVVEIKGTHTAIHNLEWFHKRGMLNKLNPESREDLLAHHPMLEMLV